MRVKMAKRTAVALSLGLAAACFAALAWNAGGGGAQDSPAADAGGSGAIRILGIGNSFTVDALNEYLHKLAAADGRRVVTAHLTIGGATLEEHAANAKADAPNYRYVKTDWDGKVVASEVKSVSGAVLDEKWDYVCFQQQSWLAGQFDSYEAWLPELAAFVKDRASNPDMTCAILQTWAFAHDYGYPDYEQYDNDQLTMYRALVDATERAGALVTPGMLVIPAGTAIQNGRTSVIGDAFCRDGYHLNGAIGRFTVACAWYAAIFGDDVMNNPYVPENIPARHVEIAKRAARYAVVNPGEVTDMAGSVSASP